MIKSPNRECLLYLSHVTWTAACYEDFRKLKEIAAATYTCISSFKKPVFRPLGTGLFTFFHSGNNVVYDAFVFGFVLFCLFRFVFFSFFSFFFLLLLFFILVSYFFGRGRGGFSSCASDESSSKHIKLTSVTLASIVSISMSVILLFLIMSEFYQSQRFCWTLWNANDGKECL